MISRRSMGAAAAAALIITMAPRLALADAAPASTAVFDEAARLVRGNFYDPNLKGVEWERLTEKYRAAYAAAPSPAARSSAINGLLGELKSSHMIHATPEQPAYYQLVDIFRWGVRDDLKKAFPSGEITYPGIGIFTKERDGRTFVSGTVAGLPADKAGLLVGDEIVNADGKAFEPVASFRDRVGRKVAIGIRRAAGGPVQNIEVTPADIKPGDAFRNAMSDGARVIEKNGRKIGYIRIWSYAGQAYQNALARELSSGKLKDVDAFVWDLRDGWGGAQAEYLDIFNARAPDMTFANRSGETNFANFKWRKPVAMLINEGTRSGKEVLAYGFKKYGYGPVVGTRSAGSLLAGRGFLLSDNTFLMVAVNDVKVDGERLEQVGVAPTVEVPFDLQYAGGQDPQLDRAVELLAEKKG